MKKKRGCLFFVFVIALAAVLLYYTVGNGKTDIMKMIYPKKYTDAVEMAAKDYELDVYLVYSIIKVESNFKPDAQSGVGAKGLMQLMDKTAEECNRKEGLGYSIPGDLFVPEKNIYMGCSYFRKLLDTYGDLELAVTAYNAGTGNVNKWLRDETLSDGKGGLSEIPYEETRKYVKKVLKTYERYTQLYKEDSL